MRGAKRKHVWLGGEIGCSSAVGSAASVAVGSAASVAADSAAGSAVPQHACMRCMTSMHEIVSRTDRLAPPPNVVRAAQPPY